MEALSEATLPSSYNGDANDLYRPFLPALKKKDEEKPFKKIKASHWLHHTISGLLAAFMYMADVDDELCAAILGLHACLRPLCARVISRKAVAQAKQDMEKAIKEFHRKALPSEYKAALHALSHLPDQVLRYGPLPDLWSFPFEGLFAKLKPMAILNKAMPAQTMVARYEAMMGMRHILRCMRGDRGEPAADSLRVVRPTYRGYRQGLPVSDPHSIEDPKGDSLHRHILNCEYFCDGDTRTTILESEESEIIWDISEFDALECAGVRIQGARTQATATDDRYVLLRGKHAGDVPSLGQVQSMYRVQCSVYGSPVCSDRGRLLLLVKKEPLSVVPENQRLGSCGFSSSKNPGIAYIHSRGYQEYSLVSVGEVKDTCFLVPDPLVPGRSLVMSTWPLQNIQLKDPFLTTHNQS